MPEIIKRQAGHAYTLTSGFPQELIERIIDNLEDDLVTLLNCSLVCKSWVVRSRFYIFRVLDVDIKLGNNARPAGAQSFRDDDNIRDLARILSRRCTRLHDCFTNGSYVPQLIRSLRLSLDMDFARFQQAPPLSQILSEPQRVQHLQLDVRYLREISPTVKAAIHGLLQLQSLTRLDISISPSDDYYGLIPLLSWTSSSVTELRLTSIGTFGPRMRLPHIFNPDMGARKAAIHTLYLDLSNPRTLDVICPWLTHSQSPFDFSSLRQLHVWAHNFDYQTAMAPLLRAATSLEHLEVNVLNHDISYSFFTAPNETHLLPHLRFLKFSTRSGDTHFTPVSHIDNMLSRIISPMLEEVQIDVSVRGPFKVYPTVIELFCTATRWTQVDAWLAGPVHQNLRKAEIHIDFDQDVGSTWPSMDQRRAAITAHFPLAEASDIFNLILTNSVYDRALMCRSVFP
ncbi:hypothetical protein ARMSODRAFT_1013093 [Armillaria solidipes]|uniref:F-box domain-containing protein n=1 Tax=Armillaria solidipes TaxID=1076256 RepID=A0A2H3CFV5_9AGAR|nr:hypothetical protein ARMSODRAFT_1013093 [Armillaria solidipes]